jgi:hypothetical protein
MTDELFIKELEDYFFDGEPMSEYSVRRVKGWLKKYREDIKIPPITIYKDKIVYVDRNVYVNGMVIPPKPLATKEHIEKEGRTFCNAHGVDYKLFLKPKKKKSTDVITTVRKRFVLHMIESYTIERTQLQKYFKVDRTTIIYYIHGKPYKRKNNEQKALS